MTCQHLRKLYRLCRDHEIKVSSSDVVRIVCRTCQKVEVCPAVMSSEYDSTGSTRSDTLREFGKSNRSIEDLSWGGSAMREARMDCWN